MSSFTQAPWPTWAYNNEVNEGFSGYQQYPNYSSYLADSMEAYQTHHHHLVHHHQMSRTTESKPRLSKEEVEVLEAEFQKNHKPNSSTKKALAESMRVDNARINNWFQNRRAREKKERNIREYEARQKLEKQKGEADGDNHAMPDRNNDLVASSAPFPNAQRSAQAKRHPSSDLDQDSDAGTSYVSDENADPIKAEAPEKLPHGLFGVPSLTGPVACFARDDCTSPSNDTSDANDADFALSTDDEEPDYYVKQVQQAIGGGQFRDTNPMFGYGADNMAGFPPAHSSPEDDHSLRTPPSLDIASRRNRRPPPLAIDSRSYSVGAPRTGLDMVRRGDTMRRVASATGSMRITKPMGAPRSPFQMSRSPVSNGPRGHNAPPTPDTPILANQPAVSSMDAGHTIADLAIRDPTLRTPPTTPGVAQNFFSLNSVYDMPITEGSLSTPSLARFPDNLDVSNISMGMSHYSGSCVSQPHTPSFVSPMSHASFGVNTNGAEYNWPNTLSRNASPVEQQQSARYLNLPVSNFGMER